MTGDAPTRTEAAERRARRLQLFDAAMDRLEEAATFAKAVQQGEVIRLADLLRRTDEGLAALAERAPRFEPAGVFVGGPWADAEKLQPQLVRGSLDAGGTHAAMETLDLLRMAAVAAGEGESSGMTPAEASAFIDEVLALNLDLVVGHETEASRSDSAKAKRFMVANQRLLRYLFENAASPAIGHIVVEEIEALAAQRPILTQPVRALARNADTLGITDAETQKRLLRFVAAIDEPTTLATECETLADYAVALDGVDDDALGREARAAAELMRDTGLGSRHQAVLVRHLLDEASHLIPEALGLDDHGKAEWAKHETLVRELMALTIHAGTCQVLYGWARLLERGLLSRGEVREGLVRLADLPLARSVERTLAAGAEEDGVDVHAWLVAGTVSVLGQPLGIGQGHNPTCQSARGLSLWSQHRPGDLLSLLATAARDGHVTMDFLGDRIDSRDLGGGLAKGQVTGLDPVSRVLVPHLDRIYDEMMRRVANRIEDGHLWVNPALYGRLVPEGFRSAFNKTTGAVVDHKRFITDFVKAFHLDINGGQRPLYPVPIGLVITSGHAKFLGFHAVSLQRVAPDPNRVLRVYFYNPNTEGRQDWGQEIVPSVHGHGERPGESSLPFEQFASRVYAFHFDPFVMRGATEPDKALVDEVSELARSSWGADFAWS